MQWRSMGFLSSTRTALLVLGRYAAMGFVGSVLNCGLGSARGFHETQAEPGPLTEPDEQRRMAAGSRITGNVAM